MVATKTLVLAAVAAVLYAPTAVAGHGYLMVPKAKLASSGDPTKYAALIYGPSALKAPAGMKYTDTIQNNLKAFTTAFKSSGFSSLASFIKKKAPSAGACGTTSLTPSSPQTVGDYVQWSSFVESHVGPCEVWCDSKRVFQNDNCAGNYKSAPARLAISKSACASSKQLVFYWLALHEVNWQVYINCVSLKGKESRSMDDEDDTAVAIAGTDEGEAAVEQRATDEDCDEEELPEPSGSADCDDELPEPPVDTEDCDEDLPEPSADADADADADDCDDCGEDYPEPSDDAAGDVDATSPATTAPTNEDGETDDNADKKDDAAGDVADADCEDELPEPDCDDELPEPNAGTDADCDEDDLPEPGYDADTPTVTPASTEYDEYARGTDDQNAGYSFDALQQGAGYKPGKAETEEY